MTTQGSSLSRGAGVGLVAHASSALALGLDSLREKPAHPISILWEELELGGRTAIYAACREDGAIFGIKLLRVGNRWLIPTLPLLRVLGVEVEDEP